MFIVIHIQAKNVLGVDQATRNMDEVNSEGKWEIVKREAIPGMLSNLLLRYIQLFKTYLYVSNVYISRSISISLVVECRTTVANPFPSRSVPESDKPCVFPFQYKGKEFNECTTEGYGSQFWCGTTYSVGEWTGWGLCSGPCPSLPGE